jgi:DNA-binding transcriptional regulator YiaG
MRTALTKSSWLGCLTFGRHVTEWKKGRNLPNAETALTMMELIKTKPKK